MSVGSSLYEFYAIHTGKSWRERIWVVRAFSIGVNFRIPESGSSGYKKQTMFCAWIIRMTCSSECVESTHCGCYAKYLSMARSSDLDKNIGQLGVCSSQIKDEMSIRRVQGLDSKLGFFWFGACKCILQRNFILTLYEPLYDTQHRSGRTRNFKQKKNKLEIQRRSVYLFRGCRIGNHIVIQTCEEPSATKA